MDLDLGITITVDLEHSAAFFFFFHTLKALLQIKHKLDQEFEFKTRSIVFLF